MKNRGSLINIMSFSKVWARGFTTKCHPTHSVWPKFISCTGAVKPKKIKKCPPTRNPVSDFLHSLKIYIDINVFLLTALFFYITLEHLGKPRRHVFRVYFPFTTSDEQHRRHFTISNKNIQEGGRAFELLTSLVFFYENKS